MYGHKTNFRAAMFTGVVLVLALLLPACRGVFPFPGNEHLDDDAAVTDGLRPAPDASAPVKLSCYTPVRVGLNSKSDEQLVEPAISVDGKKLYARNETAPDHIYSITRGDSNFLDTEWVLAGEGINMQMGRQDLSFFEVGQQQYMMAAVEIDENNRYLELCSWADPEWSNCQKIEGPPVDLDVDGPTVVIPSTEMPLMLFNTAGTGLSGIDHRLAASIYQATSTPGDLIGWVIESLLLDEPNVGEDDPVLNPDGTIVVYKRITWNADKSDTIHDLYYASRPSIHKRFSKPELLLKGVKADIPYAPELYELENGDLELFYTRIEEIDDVITSHIYRTVCQIL